MAEKKQPGEVPELEVENPKTGMPKDMGEKPADVPTEGPKDPLNRPDKTKVNTQTFRNA